jgi:hypothetical protein
MYPVERIGGASMIVTETILFFFLLKHPAMES